MLNKKRFWITAVFLVFMASLIWHMPASLLFKTAQTLLPAGERQIEFENATGGIWAGQTQLSWPLPNNQGTLNAGQLSWQQSPMDLIGALTPALDWQTQFGNWQGHLKQSWDGSSTAIETEVLRLNIAMFQKWLSPFFRSPFEVQGLVESNDLRFDWSTDKLLTQLQGTLLLQGLSTMGVSLPPVQIELQMPDKASQQVHWRLSAQGNGYQLSGSGKVDGNPASQQFASYSGVLEVKAESLQQMPDFSNLMPQLSETHSQLSFNGNLKNLQR